MFSFQFAVLFALAINLQHVKGLMVKAVDGSFVPWSLVSRAGGPIGVLMNNNHDLSYLASVLMGTPPQEIQMAVSLSQNFISVASPAGGVNDPSYYNPASSSSHVPIDQTANLTTISGQNAIGRYAGEVCTINSATSAASFTYNASVVVTDPSVTTDLFPSGARAVLGYGVNAPSDSPPNTSLVPSFLPKNFTNAVCGIELNHFTDPFPGGVLTMGAVDTTAFTGDFSNVMVPPTSTVSWSIPLDTITYLSNGTNQLVGVAGGLSSVDMYHSTIQVTNEVANQIYSGTAGAKPISATEWSIPCNATFPITLTFAGTAFTISNRDTVVRQSYGTCTGVVTGGATGIGKVGAPFMRTVYTQFAASQTANGLQFSVGFAQKVQRQAASPTLTAGPTATAPPQTTILPSSSSTTTTSGARATIHSSPMLGLIVVSIAVMIFL